MEDPNSYSEIIIMIVKIISLLFLSAFFSASETALTSMNRLKVKDLIENEDNENAREKLHHFLHHPNQLLTTILVMNNLVNILVSSLTTAFIIELIPGNPGQVVGIVTGVLTLMILIFGEITPKVYARENTEKFFNVVFPVISFLNYILKPIIWLLVNISNFFIKLFGGEKISEAPFITEDEIMNYLDIGHEEGVIEKDEKFIMKRGLELKEISVKEIMTPRVDIIAISEDENLKELIKIINEEGYSRIPIYKESIDNIIGVCYAKDVFKILEKEGLNEEFLDINIKNIMHRVEFIPLTMKIRDVMKIFLEKHTHMAIVVDEYGGTAGLVTLEDILEELTGEILDEYDIVSEEINIVKLAKNTYLVNGTTPINDIERELDLELPETDFETIGGLLLEEFERFPKAGEKITLEGVIFEIVSVSKNKIDKVKITVKEDFNENKTGHS
ncbi:MULTISPECIES: hemolysin family protein [unclassified Marinitoga]|uniref:hemolysin family protein n=1 Tax=unclassified Marinitoga TaxID=2640159 RepID=UPI00064172A7|nr:hemolysin family protein [Marinitoga sp. 1155]KLO21421.1 hemolysin [Marinitoga sp. 1155]NUU99797.1 hemolysin [Marinitoga sp. 1154]